MNPIAIALIAELAARRADHPDGGLPAWVPTTPPVEASRRVEYRLRPSGDGYVYQATQFEARIAPDGVVTFKDISPQDLNLRLFAIPLTTPRTAGPSSDRVTADPALRRTSPWLIKLRQPAPAAVRATSRVDSTVYCPPDSACYFPPPAEQNLVSVSGNFDLADEIMRARGEDPYGSEKARFLSSTFELRMDMATKARAKAMKKALADLPENLDQLWKDQRYTPRERRRILFELWHQMDSNADGVRAAGLIEAFVAEKLPCGAPEGYTPDELRAFSKAHPENRFPALQACKADPDKSAP